MNPTTTPPDAIARPDRIGPAAWENTWRHYAEQDREDRWIVRSWLNISAVLGVSRERARAAAKYGDKIAGTLIIYRSGALKGPDSAAWAYVSDLCDWDDRRTGKEPAGDQQAG